MWNALKAELAYFRPWIFGGLGLAVGVVLLISGIFYAVGDEGPAPHDAAGIRAMFMMMAPAILSIVILALRTEEKRPLLLMAGPLTPRGMAGVTVLVPTVLFAVGVLCAALTLTINALVFRTPAGEWGHIIGFVGGLILMMQMVGLLGQEAAAAHREGRSRDSWGGWSILGVLVLAHAAVLTAGVIVQGPGTWPSFHVANLVVAAVALATCLALYSKRTDFTH